jgi:TPR repeat protein
MHLHGLGTPANCRTATDYFKIVAEALFVDNTVEDALEHAESGNYRKAAVALNEAAQQGSSVAQLEAASLYKYSCRHIMDAMDVAADEGEDAAADGDATAGNEVWGYLASLVGEDLLDELRDNVLSVVREVAARWTDAAINLINGLLQDRVIQYPHAAAALRLHPFCSVRAIEYLERAAAQDKLSSVVELGDLLYDAGTGGGIGSYFALAPEVRDNPDNQAKLQLAAYYYRRAVTDGRNAKVSVCVGIGR